MTRRRDVVGILLGVIGEVLLTAGVLVGLFVVWQVWWSDIQARDYTAGVIETLDFAPVANATDLIEDDEKRGAPAPATPMDGVFATLRVPAWGADYEVPIAQGTGAAQVLDLGMAGHYSETVGPGEIGNFAVAGHRQSHGAIFAAVDQLASGEALVVQTAENFFVYTVTSTEVVAPEAVEVIAPVPGDPAAVPVEADMTMTTCHPLWSTRQRFVVHATLAYWAPVSAGVPAELEG